MNAEAASNIPEKRRPARKVRRVVKRLSISVVVFALVMVAGLLIFRAYERHRVRQATKITSPPGVESLEAVTLGGIEQWILIRGRDRSKPLMLVVHGGPGVSEMLFSHRNAELEKEFVVVQWDQRGAGKSYAPDTPRDSMNVEQFVADTHELSQLLTARFHTPKLYLVGVSWGSILATLTASRYPELFHACVGVGQVADVKESQRILYRFAMEAAERAGNRRAIADLTKLGPVFMESADHMRVCRWISRLTADQYPGIPRWELLRDAIGSPSYDIADFWKLYRGMKFSIDCLWRPLNDVNLFEQAPRIEVPVYFFLGRHDYVVTSEVAERYFHALDAPRGKQIVWFEKSGHMPHLEEPEKYRAALIGKVLAETRR